LIRRVVFLIFAGCFTLVACNSLTPRAEELNRILKQNKLNGTVLIATGKDVLLSEGRGYSNRETKIENIPRTQFLVGSVTKLLTATAILKLIDQGKIEETAFISAYLPSEDRVWGGKAPSWIDQITIQNLLTHSSGLESYLKQPGFDIFYEHAHNSEELVRFFASTPLKFKPGTQFEYSGSGYNLLGLIIERISGIGYGQYLQQEIFTPLAMNSSFATHDLMLSQVELDHPEVAIGYVLGPDGVVEPAGEVNLTTAFAEGSLISTASDLHTWAQALFSLKIISEESLKKMTYPYLETKREGIWMGYGLFIDKTDPDHLLYYHSGLINGYESFWSFEPQRQTHVIVLSNEMGGAAYDTAEALLKAQNND
jgi:CubicO group peptidase (beta-lactamase class C family)